MMRSQAALTAMRSNSCGSVSVVSSRIRSASKVSIRNGSSYSKRALCVPPSVRHLPTFRTTKPATLRSFSSPAPVPPVTPVTPPITPPYVRSNLRTALYGIGGTILLTTTAGITYAHNYVGGTDGLVRTASFYSIAIPLYLQYRLLQYRDAPTSEWEELHERASKQALDKILHLRGFYIKSGQMAASNIGNGFPKIWQDTMSILQDQVPHKPFPIIKSIVETELGKPLGEIFSRFEEVPLGAASIGQTHRATLKSTGEDVVVKVQYPEVESLFRGDVRTMKMFCEVAQPVHVAGLEQVEKQFLSEFDYLVEAKQQERIRWNLEKGGLSGKAGGGFMCKVPRAYLELCTRSVLVMEELTGDKLAVALQRDMERLAASLGKSPEQFMAEEQEKDTIARDKKMLRVGPTSSEYERYRTILNQKRRISNLVGACYNLTLGWWYPGAHYRKWEGVETLPLNHAKLIDDLMYVHGHEVLIDGYFNGDPHPGNILLLDVDKGQPVLGLIDYGQVKELDRENRIRIAKLIVAFADDHREEVIRLTTEAGMKCETMNPHVIYNYTKVGIDEDNYAITDGLHIQEYLDSLEKMDHITQLAEEFVVLGRTSIMLRGLAHALCQSRSTALSWRPIAERVLREEGEWQEPVSGLVKQS